MSVLTLQDRCCSALSLPKITRTSATLVLLLLVLLVVRDATAVAATTAPTPPSSTSFVLVLRGGNAAEKYDEETIDTTATSNDDGGGVGGDEKNEEDSNGSSTTTRKKWSSLLTVNPKHILTILIKKGGLLIPKDARYQIQIMQQVMDVQKAQLNLVERELVLYNFTLSLPPDQQRKQKQPMNSNSSPNLLHVGRVRVRWDSYSEPCLDIEVDHVDVLVEFANLILSKSNWNELLDYGFFGPSKQHPYPDEDPLSFVRFNTIDLSKNLTVRVVSRPLEKEIGTFRIDLDLTDKVNELIRSKSESNIRLGNRRGCTVDEVVSTIRKYVGQSVQNFVSDKFIDLATNPLTSIAEADRVLSQARGTVLRYAEDAIGKTGDDVHKNIASKLSGWGIRQPEAKLRVLKEQALDAANRFNMNASSMRAMLGRKLDETRTVVEDATEQVGKAFADDRRMSDEIWFPDW